MDIKICENHKAECFATLFQHMKLFSEKVNIVFDSEKLFIQAIDASRISILEIYLPAKWFTEYKLLREGSFTLGINTSILFRVLSTRDKSQNICLQFDHEADDTLSIEFTSEAIKKTTFDKFFEIPLMDIDEEMMSIPVMEYQAEFSIPSLNFANLVSQLKLFGDTLEVECSEEKIQMASVSSEMGKMHVDIPIEDLSSFAIEEGETLNVSFSLNHLHSVCAYSKLAKDVEINITNEYPIRLLYQMDDSGAKFLFYLAPKLN